VLTHSPRQAHVWLIFNVRQNMIAKIAALLVATPIFAFAQAEKNGLRLEVFTEVFDYMSTLQEKPDHYVLTIQPLIKNVSDKPITIATSTYDGHPTCWGGSTVEPLACYSIGPRVIGNRIVEPSPIKFCAVVLAPGEWASLPEHEVKMASRDEAKRVNVSYSVEKVIAAKYGWWSGELMLVAEVGEAKRPNQSPEPTPMSVTPPAAQESRQP